MWWPQDPNPDVEWEASVGQIDGDGLFTAPSSVPDDGEVVAVSTVGGSVWLWSADRAATFNLSFRIEADASVSDDQRRRCILE